MAPAAVSISDWRGRGKVGSTVRRFQQEDLGLGREREPSLARTGATQVHPIPTLNGGEMTK